MSVTFPQVTFSGVHQLVFGTPIDDPHSYAHLEQTITRVPGTGQQDSWTDGIFQRAKLALRWIPVSGVADNVGWHYPASGVVLNVCAWREHQLQQKDDFTFRAAVSGVGHTCRLISWEDSKEASGYHYRVDLVIEDVNGVPFSDF